MARNALSERSAGGWERRLLPSMILLEVWDLSFDANRWVERA
jgi:hypothetical protein